MTMYILDENGMPVVENDLSKWSQWFREREKCQLAVTTIESITISTIFLAFDHDGMLYETMVFAEDETIKKLHELSETSEKGIIAMITGAPEIQRRYKTKEEAMQGHVQLSSFVEICVEKKLV